MKLPSVVLDMDDLTYHADPVPGGSFSSTGAKTILKSPAHFDWARTHRTEKRSYDVGHAVHAKVLGVGMDVVAYPLEHLTPSGNPSTKAATVAWVDEQRAAGLVPISPDDMRKVDQMAEAILAHSVARPLLERPGASEVSLFATDPETGVNLRARIDRLPDAGEQQTIAVDVKTALTADPERFNKTAADYGYDIQAEFYKHTLTLARGDIDPGFLFVVVSKSAPYLVSVIELDWEFQAIGRDRLRRAMDTYKQCRDSGEWPGYEPIVHEVAPPRWYAALEEEEVEIEV